MGVSSGNNQTIVHSSHTDCCNCADHHIIAPVRSKMKVLKKIKKKMGLAPKSCSTGSNNLPPILFHQVHGENIRLAQDGTVARRIESFCKGVTFSNRPIKILEKVCVKFLDVSNNWSGVIRFGFTSSDPANLRYSLPKYACPDLTNKPGHWAKALAERFAERDTILFYYVTASGDVHFGINGEEKGIFFSGVDTRGPLWALFDIYGNSTGIELLPQRGQMNNCRRNPEFENAAVLARFESLSLNSPTLNSPTPPRDDDLVSIYFHKTRGRNIRLTNDRCIATRSDTEFCHGYVFTARPIRLDEKIIVQVLATENMYVGAMAFGLTSCDPATLNVCDLPEDADALLDRREYWVVNKDVANVPQRGDELVFCVSSAGEVTLSRNGGPPAVFMHVDETLQLWAFFDVYGSTQKIRLVGSIQPPIRPTNVNRLRVNMPTTTTANDYRRCCVPASSGLHATSISPPPPPPLPATVSVAPEQLLQVQQLQPSLGGGTVLVVNLPPAQSNFINQQQTARIAHAVPIAHHGHSIASHGSHPSHSHSSHQSHSPHTVHHQSPVVDRSSTIAPNYGSPYLEPASGSSTYSTLESSGIIGGMSPTSWLEASHSHMQQQQQAGASGAECSICYERAIDSVLYMCGHMCMCYECAVQQWRGKGGGHCPLCRAVIRDVIRTYKS